jgi:hypothetical protein
MMITGYQLMLSMTNSIFFCKAATNQQLLLLFTQSWVAMLLYPNVQFFLAETIWDTVCESQIS